MDASYTGNMISSLRKQRDLTQKELAALLHVTDKAVSKWERGKNFPDLPLLQPLAGVLGVSVSELLGTEEEISSEAIAVISAISHQEKRSIKLSLYVFFGASMLASILFFVFYLLFARIGYSYEPESLVSDLAKILLAIHVILIVNGSITLERLKKKLSSYKDFHWPMDNNMILVDYIKMQIDLWRGRHTKDSK